jgi:hypothetical protein
VQGAKIMSKSTYPLKLPQSLKAAAVRLAREDGVSLNQWITVAVAQKVGAVETAAEFLKKRAAGAGSSDMLEIMRKVRDISPVPGDEMPD